MGSGALCPTNIGKVEITVDNGAEIAGLRAQAACRARAEEASRARTDLDLHENCPLSFALRGSHQGAPYIHI